MTQAMTFFRVKLFARQKNKSMIGNDSKNIWLTCAVKMYFTVN